MTRQRDALNAERRQPADGRDRRRTTCSTAPTARSGLLDLFEGRPQLIIYHFMFDPAWEDGCPSCTAGTDELSPGFLEHLHTRDTSYAHGLAGAAGEARAVEGEAGLGHPLVLVVRRRDFNYDFGVTIDESRRPPATTTTAPRPSSRRWARTSSTADQPFEMPGRSCFLHVDGRVFHTYSQYARGLGVDRRLVLLPRPHRARSPGGVGGAEGPQRLCPVRHPDFAS